MDTTCVDAVFGKMTYRHRWYKKQKEVIFDEEHEITIVARAYSGKAITDAQRKAYQSFEEEKERFYQTAAQQLINYINQNFREFAQQWPTARKVENTKEVARLVTPTTLVLKQNGTMLLLFECVWDEENGVAVKLLPNTDVGSQDLFL